MQIEQGKFYKTRDGRKVGPIVDSYNGFWPFRLGEEIWYKDDGHSCRGSSDDIRASDDLIAEWTDEPTGTLQWLADNHGLKAGDTVECVENCVPKLVGAIGVIDIEGVFSGDVKLNPTFDETFGRKFRIVSRADDKPKIWDDMTDVEKGALLLHKHEGGDVEVSLFGNSKWRLFGDPSFTGCHAYRIKPEPVVETVVSYGDAGGNFITNKVNSDTHKLTYTTTNGVIDCDSVKMEVL